MAQKSEKITLTSPEWTLVELDPDADGYIKVTIEQLNTNYQSTEYSPINTVDSPTAKLEKWKQHFITDVYIKNVNASPTKPVVFSIIREDKYESSEVRLFDGLGNPIKSFDGALNTHDPHGHRVIINERFHQHTATTTTLAADAPAGSTQITVASATGFAVGQHLHIQNGVIETVHPQITVLAGTLATLDRPLDNSFSAGNSVSRVLQNMNVVGTLASPQSFRVHAPANQIWHLETILTKMTHSSAADDGLFGNLPALTNGCVLRKYNGATDSYSTLTVWKENGDIYEDTGDIKYSPRSGGGGSYGTNSKGGILDNSGAVVRLDGTVGDYLEILIQDDLSDLASFKIKTQGHIEGV